MVETLSPHLMTTFGTPAAEITIAHTGREPRLFETFLKSQGDLNKQ